MHPKLQKAHPYAHLWLELGRPCMLKEILSSPLLLYNLNMLRFRLSGRFRVRH